MIIVDTREKNPLPVKNFIVKKLDYGDYSIEGKEEELAVERKSASDFYNSVQRASFWRELHMMGKMKKAYLLCEFNEEDIVNFPFTLPKNRRRRLKTQPAFVLRMLKYIKENYKIKVIVAGDRVQAQFHLEKILC